MFLLNMKEEKVMIRNIHFKLDFFQNSRLFCRRFTRFFLFVFDFFEILDRSIKTKVKLGNNEIVEVSGKGTINVITEHGKKSIFDVYFVLGLKHNLISVG